MIINRQTAVGAFVLGGAALAVTATVLFGQFHLFNPPKSAAIVFQNSISGLNVGSQVTFRGVRVGSVSDIAIRFDTKTGIAYIPVTVALEATKVQLLNGDAATALSLHGLIARGLRAELNVQSFVTGQSEINLNFDEKSPATLHPDITSLEEIPTQSSAIERVKDQLSQLPLRELATNTSAALQSLRALAEKLDSDLPPLVASLKTTSDRSAQAVQTATQVIADLQGRLDTTLGDISRLAVDGDRQLGQRGAELHTLLLSSNQTVVMARDALSDLKSLTAERSASRANIDSTLRDLAAATASLRGFANDVEHNPQLLLTGRRP